MAAKAGKPRATRNKELIRGIGRFSRSKMYHKRGIWAIKKHNGGSFPVNAKPRAEPAVEEKKKLYPGEDIPKPHINMRRKHKPAKLRASITPGTILIILTGPFKGKRVVFLKQLDSGLLLVTGPFKVNGVPLRRVNKAYAIATSTKIDVSSVDVTKYNDRYFERVVVKKSEEGFFKAEEKPTKNVAPQRKEDQKILDEQVMKLLVTLPNVKHYLSARFSLRTGMRPHDLIF